MITVLDQRTREQQWPMQTLCVETTLALVASEGTLVIGTPLRCCSSCDAGDGSCTTCDGCEAGDIECGVCDTGEGCPLEGACSGCDVCDAENCSVCNVEGGACPQDTTQGGSCGAGDVPHCGAGDISTCPLGDVPPPPTTSTTTPSTTMPSTTMPSTTTPGQAKDKCCFDDVGQYGVGYICSATDRGATWIRNCEDGYLYPACGNTTGTCTFSRGALGAPSCPTGRYRYNWVNNNCSPAHT